MKDSFILYQSFYHPIKVLSDEEKGQILDAIFQYHAGVQVRELTPACQMAFQFMKFQFDRNNEKYQAIVNRNKENGAKGGRPKNPEEPIKPSGLIGNPEEPKKADNDNDNDNDNEINEVFEFWNSKNIIQHTGGLTDKIKKTISRALKTHGSKNIKSAIDHYSESYHSGFKLTSYKWGLCEFLKQDNTMPEFFEDGSKWQNYLTWKTSQSNLKQENQLPTKQLQRCER